MNDSALARAAAEAVTGTLADPFALLGPHGGTVRTFQPGAERVELLARDGGRELGRLEHARDGLWAGPLPEEVPYLLCIRWPDGGEQVTEDPYAFGLVLGELDLHLFAEGRHFRLADVFGAQPRELEGVPGVADDPSGPLLDLYLLEKAAYEVRYESANRPGWVDIPVAGLRRVAERILGGGA